MCVCVYRYEGGPKIPRIGKKNYSKYSYNETLGPFKVLPLWLDAAIPVPLPLLETLSKIVNRNAVKGHQWFSGNIWVPSPYVWRLALWASPHYVYIMFGPKEFMYWTFAIFTSWFCSVTSSETDRNWEVSSCSDITGNFLMMSSIDDTWC